MTPSKGDPRQKNKNAAKSMVSEEFTYFGSLEIKRDKRKRPKNLIMPKRHGKKMRKITTIGFIILGIAILAALSIFLVKILRNIVN